MPVRLSRLQLRRRHATETPQHRDQQHGQHGNGRDLAGRSGVQHTGRAGRSNHHERKLSRRRQQACRLDGHGPVARKQAARQESNRELCGKQGSEPAKDHTGLRHQ